MHQIIKQAAKLPPGRLSASDTELVERIASLYPTAFVTGTGLWSPESANDFDICISCAKRSAIEALDLQNVNDIGSFGSIRPEDSMINIICLSEKYYDKWLVATRMLSSISPIADQQTRHGVFEALCGVAAASQLRARAATPEDELAACFADSLLKFSGERLAEQLQAADRPPHWQTVMDAQGEGGAAAYVREATFNEAVAHALCPPEPISPALLDINISATAGGAPAGMMSTAQALETVHTMAHREYENMLSLDGYAYAHEFYRDALNAVEDFIVNHFGEE